MYEGKNLNNLIYIKNEPGYGWLARTVYNAGNSIVENATSNIPFWAKWHFNLSFIRIEVQTESFSIQPKLMPLTFISTINLSSLGNFDPFLSFDHHYHNQKKYISSQQDYHRNLKQSQSYWRLFLIYRSDHLIYNNENHRL